MNEWSAGETPWIRAEAIVNDGQKGSGFARCFFCGGDTMKVSFGDDSGDTGRLRVYCQNSVCDVREATIIVERDGAHADMRADVRALRAVDRASHTIERKPPVAVDLRTFLTDPDNDNEVIRARRQNHAPITFAYPGSES